jgi:hypothetical protein
VQKGHFSSRHRNIANKYKHFNHYKSRHLNIANKWLNQLNLPINSLKINYQFTSRYLNNEKTNANKLLYWLVTWPAIIENITYKAKSIIISSVVY